MPMRGGRRSRGGETRADWRLEETKKEVKKDEYREIVQHCSECGRATEVIRMNQHGVKVAKKLGHAGTHTKGKWVKT